MGDPATYTMRLLSTEQLWRRWAELGNQLSAAEWTTSTRCPGWDVAALFAHVSMFPTVLAAPLPPSTAVPSSGELVPLTAVEILRGYNEPGGVAHARAGAVADLAVKIAAERSRDELTAKFAEQGPAAVARLRGADPATLVPWPSAGTTTLSEALRIVLLESAVHLLDVLRAVDLPPDLPPDALGEVVHLLADLVPAVDFLEAATGRTTTSPFPVLR